MKQELHKFTLCRKQLKLNIKAKHESRTRLNQLGRLAHNRYASFAHFIREKIRNFFSYFYPKTACHSKIFENSRFVKEMKEHLKTSWNDSFLDWEERFDEMNKMNEMNEKIHSEKDGICLIDVFENIHNLEINHFFVCNYINNPSLYNAYLANELDERKYNNDRIMWSGWLERWKNRF